MLSLDINADILLDEAKKEKLFGEWKEAVDMFYSAAGQIPGLKIIEDPMLDRTKLNMDMGDLGLTGNELEGLLNERGIFVELVTGNIIMGMTGIGTTKEHVERLITALKDIASGRRTEDCTGAKEQPGILTFKPERAPVPEEKESVLIDDCAGRVCAGSIIPYPPGIPLLCPGEVITKELIDYVKKLRSMGEKVIGVSSAGEILVGK
jgi:lysine decarboxylase